MVRRSPALSALPSDGLEGRGKSENDTLFYWIPTFGENDGGEGGENGIHAIFCYRIIDIIFVSGA